ncbi:MAG TPA: hypothetical protein ENI76_09685, partial [Ignavibacteria bacterium]|nr:hypothetical protein [Ignavibacteria bacterium]
MSKRITSSRVNRWAIGLGITGVPLAVLLIWFMVSLGSITITGYSNDTLCVGSESSPCYAYINFSVNEDIFIYPGNWTSTPFYTNPKPKSVRMYRSWGKGWREIKLNQSCKGTWCGLSNSKDKRKFAFAFRGGRDYQIRYKVIKTDPTIDMKWGYDKVDPVFLGINKKNILPKLISNNVSLTYGEAIFEVNNPFRKSIDAEDLKFNFYKDKIGKYNVYINYSEKYKVPIYGKITEIKSCFKIDNSTGLNSSYDCSTTKSYIQGYKNKYKSSWKKIDEIPKGLHKIKLVANWKAKLGKQSREWVPIILLNKTKFKLSNDIILEKSEWAWWNSTWTYKTNFSINSNVTSTLTNFP